MSFSSSISSTYEERIRSKISPNKSGFSYVDLTRLVSWAIKGSVSCVVIKAPEITPAKAIKINLFIIILTFYQAN